jgi:hypothetical protein
MTVGRSFLALLILPTILLGAIGIPVIDRGEAAGGMYFVAPDGDDNNPGTENEPWKTIHKSADTLEAGDTVYIKAGTYHENISINASGSEMNGYITFQNFENDEVIMDGTGIGATSMIDINDRQYIKIIGFNITNLRSDRGTAIHVRNGSHHIEIRNNKLSRIMIAYGASEEVIEKGISAWSVAIRVTGNNATRSCHDIIIDGNEITEGEPGWAENLTLAGNVENFQVSNNIIHHTKKAGIDIAGHGAESSDPTNNQARNGVIRGNSIYQMIGEYGTAIYVEGARDLIIEKNTISSANNAIVISCETVGETASGISVRNNLIYNNTFSGIAFGGWIETYGTVTDCHIFNNTIHGDYVQIVRSSNCEVKNNILFAEGSLLYNKAGDAIDVTFDNNSWYSLNGGSRLFQWEGNWYDGLASYQSATGQDPNSFYGDPVFKNVSDFDFHLKQTSPAIDSGAFLSRTASTGSGTQIPLEDSSYFTDGFGVGEGDIIRLEGQSEIAQIVHVDYEGDVITVNTPLSWSSGQGVSLPYYGNSPDIGAFEYDPGGDDPTFVDVPLDHWAHDYIETLYQEGYIAGCNLDPLMYCPETTMTRAESAVFVERGIHGSEYLPDQSTQQIFTDVPLAEWFAKWATALWVDGYTEGCGTDPLIYCPLMGHTRAEGSVFFLRMMHGSEYVPPEPTGIFADVPATEWYADWAEAAYNAGIIPACQTEPEFLFCPEDPLDRAMAAYMMVQAKGLQVP